jgi:hypothetical protein
MPGGPTAASTPGFRLWMAVALPGACLVALAAYLLAFATGVAADGLGWLFAVTVYTILIACFGAPVAAVVSAVLALSSPARATHPRWVTLAVVVAVATTALWGVTRNVLPYVPRGPTG